MRSSSLAYASDCLMSCELGSALVAFSSAHISTCQCVRGCRRREGGEAGREGMVAGSLLQLPIVARHSVLDCPEFPSPSARSTCAHMHASRHGSAGDGAALARGCKVCKMWGRGGVKARANCAVSAHVINSCWFENMSRRHAWLTLSPAYLLKMLR
jgi:hypothetical protein